MRRRSILAASVVVAFALPAFADWSSGDGQNMHYPQLPDPQGWDVEVFRHELADDWQAMWSQPITEIHFWTSWLGDAVGTPETILVRFYDDAGGLPGTQLWSRTFGITEITIVSPAGTGFQGFYIPEGPAWLPNDHVLYQQINITSIMDAFVPTAGTVYWLSLEVDWSGIQAPVGWKSSLDAFGAGAVWNDWYAPGWSPLTDPGGAPLQLAFVVGPGRPIAVGPDTWARMKTLYR